MGKIPTPYIVDIPIPIVVNARCTVYFCGIVPDIVAQVFVVILDARINDRDNYLFSNGTEVLLQYLPIEDLKTMLIAVPRVIGHLLVVRKQIIGLRVHNIGGAMRNRLQLRLDRPTNARGTHDCQRMGINSLGTSRRKKRFNRRHAIAL